MRQIIMTMFIHQDIRDLLIETAPAAPPVAYACKRMDTARPNGFGHALVGGCVR
jgi:hypothetical protein